MQGEKSLNPCNDVGPVPDPRARDPIPKYCEPTDPCNQKEPSHAPDYAWLKEASLRKTGAGESGNCDPMMTGQIFNLTDDERQVVYRFNNTISGHDEAMMDLFSNIYVKDEQGQRFKVPIVWGSQEKAAAVATDPNVRKDNSIVTDCIILPIMAMHMTSMTPRWEQYIYHKAVNWQRDKHGHPGFIVQEKRPKDTAYGIPGGIPMDFSYTLYLWTYYTQDMYQIAEQVITKFSQIAYIRVRGVQWEVPVKLDSYANNVDLEPGAEKDRILKAQFTLTAQGWIPQPIQRAKTVLKTVIQTELGLGLELGINDEEIQGIVENFEEATKGLEC